MEWLWRWVTRTGPETHDRCARPDCVFCGIANGRASGQSHLLHEDSAVVAFEDRSPAAGTHILVCPRAHILSARHLRGSADAELAAHMQAVGRRLLDEYAPGAQQEFGYHLPPFNSVDHLHLHCFALPFTPPWKVYKYTTAGIGCLWYLPSSTLLERLDAGRGGARGGYSSMDGTP